MSFLPSPRSSRRLAATGALLATGIALLAPQSRDGDRTATDVFTDRSMTPAQLAALSERLDQAIYWPTTARRLSVTRTRSGVTLVRGDRDGAVVATYPMAGAARNLRRQAERNDRLVLASANDGTPMLLDRENAGNVYLAPGPDHQVEVHAEGDRAVGLAADGGVEPIALLDQRSRGVEPSDAS